MGRKMKSLSLSIVTFIGVATAGLAQAQTQARRAPPCPQIGMLVQTSVFATRPDLDKATKRLAYVNKALVITASEQAAWEGYASAVMTIAGRQSFPKTALIDLHPIQTAPDQMRRRISDVENVLAGLKIIQPFERSLYEALTPDQKAVADKLVSLDCVAWDTGN